MRRLLLACSASILLYLLAFGAVLDRKLSYGFLADQIEARLADGAAIQGRKLVILAGSNGPYSHRCETIGPILGLPCVNAGVAVGIGLDMLFLRWEQLLRPGDVVYLPMEPEQYVRTRAATEAGPDAAILFRHDWATLAQLPSRRWLAAAFAFDARSLVMSGIEEALVLHGFHDPRTAVTGASNAWGDHVGHTAALARGSRDILRRATPFAPTGAEVAAGYGASLIAGFVERAGARGVTVIGGLSTGFADIPLPDATLAAMRAVYCAHGGRFLELPNRSRYPRADFFDTPEHLNETWQAVHSLAVARGLMAMGVAGDAPMAPEARLYRADRR